LFFKVVLASIDILFKKVYEEEIEDEKIQLYSNEILNDSSYLSKHRVSNWMKERKKLFNYFLPFLFALSFLKYGHLIALCWIRNSFLENERNELKLIKQRMLKDTSFMGMNEKENEANQSEVYKYSFIHFDIDMDPNMSFSEFYRLSSGFSLDNGLHADIDVVPRNNKNGQDHKFSKKYDVNIMDSIIAEFKGFICIYFIQYNFNNINLF
jgi:hypothetical protein